ncbi:MAG: hypothetical protein AAFR16_09460 [Pseudomonadota bacterium]
MRAPHRRTHGVAAAFLAIAVPAIFVIAFVLRPDRDAGPEPVRLEPPAPAAGEAAQ